MDNFNFRYDQNNNMYVDTKSISSFVSKVYMWMTGGVTITLFVAIATFSNKYLFNLIYGNNLAPLIAFGAMMFISFNMNISVARSSINYVASLFILYSVLNGLCLSVLGFLYSYDVLVLSLTVTSILFLILSLYGYLTNEDLGKLRSLILVSLVFLIVFNLVNLFFRMDSLRLFIAYAGALTFMVLIAYETNKLKKMAVQISSTVGEENLDKYAILGAFSLYLSFINLFIYILRILSDRKKRD